MHIGFGTIISSMDERRAARQGLKVGHWPLHLYSPTHDTEPSGDGERMIEDGRPLALDDPGIRQLAGSHATHCPAQLWLQESWIPAIPDINVQGEYWRHHARDPMAWVEQELDICRNWHHMLAPMVGADPRICHDDAGLWNGGCFGQPGLHDHDCHDH